jgi:hypothetical protein
MEWNGIEWDGMQRTDGNGWIRIYGWPSGHKKVSLLSQASSFDLGFLVEPSFKLRFITLREAVTDCTNKQANKHGRGRETHENDR